MVNSTFRLCLFFIICISCANAQPVTEYPPVRFKLIGWDDELPGVYILNEGGKQEIDVPFGRRSKTYTYIGPPSIKLYRSVRTESAKTAPEYITSVSLPNGFTEGSIVVFGSEELDKPYSAIAVPFGMEDIQKNTVSVINFSPQNLAVNIEGDVVQLSPGDIHVLPYPEGKKYFDMRIAAKVKDTWTIIYGGPQRVTKNGSMMLYVTTEKRQTGVGGLVVDTKRLVEF